MASYLPPTDILPIFNPIDFPSSEVDPTLEGVFLKKSGDTASGAITFNLGLFNNAQSINNSGSAAIPSITFSGSTSSGIYSSNPDNIDVSISGNNVLNINSTGVVIDGDIIHNGNFIIDDTSTEALLVRKNGDSGDVFTVNTTNERVSVDGITPELYIGNQTTATQSDLNFYHNSGNSRIRFHDSGGLKGFIEYDTDTLSPGRMRIVNTNGNKELLLGVNGSTLGITMSADQGITNFATFKSNTSQLESTLIIDNTNASAFLVRKDNNTGDVLIVDTGTAFPSVKMLALRPLTVAGTASVGVVEMRSGEDYSPWLRFRKSGGGVYNNTGIILSDFDLNNFFIYTDGPAVKVRYQGTVASASNLDPTTATDVLIISNTNVRSDVPLVADLNNDKAFNVRKSNNSKDVFTVNTNASTATVNGTTFMGGLLPLSVSGDASVGFIQMGGGDNYSPWLRFRRGGNGTFNSAGIILSHFNTSNFFVYANGPVIAFRYQEFSPEVTNPPLNPLISDQVFSIGATEHISTKPMRITNSTATTSKTTGALIVTGGIGAGGLYTDEVRAGTFNPQGTSTTNANVITLNGDSSNNINKWIRYRQSSSALSGVILSTTDAHNYWLYSNNGTFRIDYTTNSTAPIWPLLPTAPTNLFSMTQTRATFTVPIRLPNGATDLNRYQEGSHFTFWDLPGSSGSNINYTIIGNMVTLSIPPAIGQTFVASNIVSAIALPVEIRPPVNLKFVVVVLDPTAVFGLLTVTTDGELIFGVGASGGNFTVGTGRGWEPMSVTYRI